MNVLDTYRPQIFALARMAVGLLFAMHGGQKLFGLFGGASAAMPAPLLYAAGGIELVGGILVCVGLFTRYAAFLCSGTMMVAYFLAHQSQGLLPIQNRGELAALYSWIFLLLAVAGDGKWALGSRARSSAT